MSVVVTGAAGFIGSRLSAHLLRRGEHVVGIDRFHDFAHDDIRSRRAAGLVGAASFTAVNADIASDELDAAIADATHVFHLAAQPGVRSSWARDFRVYALTNVVGTQRLLEAVVRAAPTARVVLASSSSIYGDQRVMPVREDATPAPKSPYGVTKLAAEHLALAYAEDAGLDVVVARFFTVCGPGQRPDMALARLIASARAGTPFTVFDGSWTRDYTHVDDAAEALIALADAPQIAQLVYNVAGGQRASIPELAQMVADAVGVAPLLESATGGRGDPLHTWADTSAIRRDAGWQASRSLARAVADQCAEPDGGLRHMRPAVARR